MFRKITKSTYFMAGEVIVVSGILIVIISNWIGRTNFARLFSTINSTLMPVYIGIVLAFLLCPIYNRIVKSAYKLQMSDRWQTYFNEYKTPLTMYLPQVADKKPKISTERKALRKAKGFASAVCILLVFGIVALIGYVMLPQLIDSIVNLVNTLPQRTDMFMVWVSERFKNFTSLVELIDKINKAGTNEIIAWLQTHLLNKDYQGLAEIISTSVMSLISSFANAFIGILIAVYLLNYKETLFAIGRKIIAATCSDRKAKSIYEFTGIINETFIGFIVGRLIDAVIIGILTYFVMIIVGMPMPLLISAIVGITNVIPFFGPFIGAIPSTIILLLEDPKQALYFIIMIIIIQQLDGNVIGPKIVGNAIGLSSFWVLIAVLVGGGLFGFIGMALGAPVFAVVYRYIDKVVIGKLRKRERDFETTDYLDLKQYDVEVKDILKDE